MPIQLLMPALSPTMTEGSLAKWHKKEGDEVKAGDVIAEIETDKATMEFEAVDEGTLGRILVPEGAEHIAVNQPIALLLEEGEDKSALAEAAKAPATKPASTPPPEPPATKEQAKPAAPTAPTSQSPAQAPTPSKAAPSISPPPQGGGGLGRGQTAMTSQEVDGRIFISPLARRLAAEAKVDLTRIAGTGPHGRIVKHDIAAAIAEGPSRPAATPAGGIAPGARISKEQVVALVGDAPYTEVPMTGMRRTIARRMADAKQTVPHFYLTIDCDIDALMKLRGDIADQASVKLSVNDFIIKGVALGLRRVPAANASYSDDALLRWETIDISVAVALDDGLITPIIREADKKGLAQISAEMKDLGLRARAGKLKLGEFQGGTFSISNLGMYGIKDFAAVINPPQGCILAVGAGERRAVVKNGALAVATVMSCTLACDHRVVDGAVGAQFLAEFKKIIERPTLMLI
ncbi:MAG: pyruvate dehydrogenase complex dihydrolipoamide acetyltransferase [Stellaceae bacterium]